MKCRRSFKRLAVLATFGLGLMVVSSCAEVTQTDASLRVWRGPTSLVRSSGATTFDRREIAQKVDFPSCLSVGAATYRFAGVERIDGGGATPPGNFDTAYYLDRWRLYQGPGSLESQQSVAVTVRGSTGIYGRYPLAQGSC